MKKSLGDICASFQETICEVIADRCKNAIKIFKQKFPSKSMELIIVGGVAANHYLKSKLNSLTKELNCSLVAPPRELCTDNAAMIAWAAIEKIKIGAKHNITFKPTPRWQLDDPKAIRTISEKK